MAHIHTVGRGECLTMIAHRYGFADHAQIYDHAENAELKKKRPNPNVLFPGDKLFIPDRDDKEVECATGSKHRFKLKVPKKELKIALVDADGKGVGGAKYTLRVRGEERQGETGGDGSLREQIDADVTEAELLVPEIGLVRRLLIGDLDPVETESGWKARLDNLGYSPDEDGLAAFQEEHDLDPDEEDLASTYRKLVEKHAI